MFYHQILSIDLFPFFSPPGVVPAYLASPALVDVKIKISCSQLLVKMSVFCSFFQLTLSPVGIPKTGGNVCKFTNFTPDLAVFVCFLLFFFVPLERNCDTSRKEVFSFSAIT